MNRLWMMCGLLFLAGCQGEEAQPVAPKPAGIVVAAIPVAPVATQTAADETVKEKPVTKPAGSTKQVLPAEKTSVMPVPKAAAPAAVVAAPAPAQQTAVAENVGKEAVPSVPAVSDEEVLALAHKNNCFACHALERKVMGPAFNAVAAKYRGDANAQAYLENKIAKGGSGVWGGAPMPAQPKLSAEERTQLARFILKLQ